MVDSQLEQIYPVNASADAATGASGEIPFELHLPWSDPFPASTELYDRMKDRELFAGYVRGIA